MFAGNYLENYLYLVYMACYNFFLLLLIYHSILK